MKTSLLPRQVSIESLGEYSTVSHAVERQLGPDHEFSQRLRDEVRTSADYHTGEFFGGVYKHDEAKLIVDSLWMLAASIDGNVEGEKVITPSAAAADILRQRKTHLFGTLGTVANRHEVAPLYDPIVKD